MTGIERRIEELEKRTGVCGEVLFVCVKFVGLDSNPECPAFKGDTNTLCIRFREFCRTQRATDNNAAVFLLNCEGCEGV